MTSSSSSHSSATSANSGSVWRMVHRVILRPPALLWMVGGAAAFAAFVVWSMWSALVVQASTGEGSFESAGHAVEFDSSFSSPNAEGVDYVHPDWRRAAPFKSPKIIVDVRFHHFSDHFGMFNLTLTPSELVDILLDVAQTWAKAGIWVRFKRSDVLVPHHIDLLPAAEFRWWVLGCRAGTACFKRDVEAYLLPFMSAEEAEKVQNRAVQYEGHALVNHALGIYGNPNTVTKDIDIYAVRYWAWYNGGAARGRIFVRAGSCNGPLPSSVDSKRDVVCNGWPLSKSQHPEIDKAEVARVMAHELGHLFGLAHPAKGACQIAPDVAHMQLMRQQRAVSVRGGEPCSETNAKAKYSRHLEQSEIDRARAIASAIAARQRGTK